MGKIKAPTHVMHISPGGKAHPGYGKLMRNQLILLLVMLSFTFGQARADGGITHMFVASEVVQQLPDKPLRDLLLANMDAYLVGAYYPDSGYVDGAHYGEISHWDPFIYAFADYIDDQYADPVAQNPRLIAFLFGCAAHSVADIVSHQIFYPVSAQHDFKNDWQTAHTYGDIGIDLLVNIDKQRWIKNPQTWWVPVADLIQVYHRMGNDQYTADEIINGNKVIAVAGFEEKMISSPAYPYLAWYKMPWTAKNYYDFPNGGLLMAEQRVSDYQLRLWEYMKSKKPHAAVKPKKIYAISESSNTLMDFGKQALKMGAVLVEVKKNADGSVELQPPLVTSGKKFNDLIAQLLRELTKK